MDRTAGGFGYPLTQKTQPPRRLRPIRRNLVWVPGCFGSHFRRTLIVSASVVSNCVPNYINRSDPYCSAVIIAGTRSLRRSCPTFL